MFFSLQCVARRTKTKREETNIIFKIDNTRGEVYNEVQVEEQHVERKVIKKRSLRLRSWTAALQDRNQLISSAV